MNFEVGNVLYSEMAIYELMMLEVPTNFVPLFSYRLTMSE